MPRWRIIIILLLATLQCLVGCAGAGKTAATTPPTPAPSSATAGATTIVAIAPPPAPAAPSCTLGGFLGLDKIGAGLGGLFQRAFSRLKNALGLTGKFPGLQPQPPVLAITDPANLSPNAPPAVQAAAKAKQDEDQAGQKIQALRYLATLGCGGCYPDVEAAMLSALDDCTESVRYEAALALKGKDGQTRCCSYCKCNDCCSDAVRKKLEEIANKMDDKGCYKEPSDRVRRVAREALAKCGGATSAQSTTTPTEGPVEAPLPDPGVSPPGPAAALPAAPAAIVPGSSAGAANANRPADDEGFSGVKLVSFEQPAIAKPDESPVLALIDGEPLYESKIFRSLDVEIARLKAQGVTVGPDRFQALLIEQTRRSIDCRLLVREARRDKARATGSEPNRPLEAAEIDAWLAEALKVDQRISLLELNARYQAEAARYRTAGQTKWEQVSVPITRLSSRDEAKLLISYLHNRAQGVRCEAPDVNLHAADTQLVDWTPRDRIASPLVAQTVAKLPAGATSPILEENGKFFIVRVLEHRPGGIIPFDQAAEAIRKEIIAERRTQAERRLIEKLRSEAVIWTAFDPPVKTVEHSVESAAPHNASAPAAPAAPQVVLPAGGPARAVGGNYPQHGTVVPVVYPAVVPRFSPAPASLGGASSTLPGTYTRAPAVNP